MSTLKAAIMLAAGFLLAACQGTAPSIDDGGDRSGPIIIGTAGPMTGQYAAFGRQMREGAAMAVDDLNAAGGVLGQPVELLIGDDRCDPRQAVTVANDMAADGIVFMAGHFCSGASIPASEVYAEENILQISPASTNPALTETGGDNVFRVVGRDDQQGAIAGTLIADSYPAATIAVLHDGSSYGQYLSQATMVTLADRGVPVSVFDSYQQDLTDAGPLVAELDQQDIDVLYVAGYHDDVGRIARALRDRGMETQLIGADALVTEDFYTVAGAASDGTLMTFYPDPRDFAEATDVVVRMRADGFEPEGYVLYAYAAVQVWAEAAERAGTTDTDALVAEMRRGSFDTVVGRLTFDDNGDIEQPSYVWYRWRDGDYRPVN